MSNKIRVGLTIVLVWAFSWLPITIAANSPTVQVGDGRSSYVAGASAPVEVSEHTEEFRVQVLDFLRETDEALVAMSVHPVLGPQLADQLGGSLQIPLAPEVYRVLEDASFEELDRIRQHFAAAPEILSTPIALMVAVGEIPTETVTKDGRASCVDDIADFARIQTLAGQQQSLTIAANSLEIVVAIIKMVADPILMAAGCEDPFDVPTSWIATPVIIVNGILDAVSIALGIASDELEFQKTDAERCFNLVSCPQIGFTERFQPETYGSAQGKGCDNRDNNCNQGIDELEEDLFRPFVEIDAAFAARCYPNAPDAEAAGRLAVHAEDDCVELAPTANEVNGVGSLEVAFGTTACAGTLSVTATDVKGNVGMASAVVAIDGMAPTITLQDLSATCQPSVDAARNALGFTVTDDCSMPVGIQTGSSVVEKECVADFEFEAIDSCGNRSQQRQSVRIDDVEPTVGIERPLLPEYEGRVCFGGEQEAVSIVSEATSFFDNCSQREDLTFVTNAQPSGPNSCDRDVASAVSDACGLSSMDSVLVRLDNEAPTVSCSVALPVLEQHDGAMVDVGFTYQVSDDCGIDDVVVDIVVTSDEPTSFQLSVKGDDDLAPDAAIRRDPTGRPAGLLLRDERKQTQSADGRVYRIRTIATDGCGNRSQADCFVSVPKVSGNKSVVSNSGQAFDATQRN
jgi:hypothetical protein